MNREDVARAFFDERYAVPFADGWRNVRSDGCANTLPETFEGDPSGGQLIPLLEAIAVRELMAHVDPVAEMAVVTRVECRHWAPLAAGSEIRITGWTEHVGDRAVTLRVHLHDEQEQVCDGRIWVDVRARADVARAIARKHAAIVRRELFGAARATSGSATTGATQDVAPVGRDRRAVRSPTSCSEATIDSLP